VLYDVFVHTPPPAEIATSSTASNTQQSYVIEYDPSAPQKNPEIPSLLSLIKRFVLRSKVRVRDVTSEYDVWAMWGLNTPERRHWSWARSGVGEPVWDTENNVWPWGETGTGLMRDRRAIGMGVRRLIHKGVRRMS
jgi:transferase CAF17, mitochondrial